jgi:hypothetical protein
MPKTKSAKKIKYKPVLKLPPLPPDQYEALKANIAVNGVLVPILVDSDGPRRKIIDGSHRKRIADELGYDCPEIIQTGLEEDEKRTLARALNLARRQLNSEQKRELIADQLEETPNWSLRRIAKMLGVSHPTVADVRAELQGTGKIYQLEKTLGLDGKYRAFPTLETEPPEVERYSPPWIVEGARKVMGTIDIDPASCAFANKTVKATKFYSQKTNGLQQHWRGRVFLNPPFGHEWKQWAEKLIEEIDAGRTKQAFLVAPGKVLWVVAAPWFRPLLKGSLFLPDERIEYLNPDTDTWQDVCLGSFCLYYGNRYKEFAKVFGDRGAILRRHNQ